MKVHPGFVASVALTFLLGLTSRTGAQTVFSGAGSAAATTARDNFRTAIGGGTTAGANGSFGGVRREINWDNVPAAQSAPNNLAANFFNVTSPRGLVVSTPGTGFQVSGATTDAGAGQPAAANFGNIDPTYTNTFVPFSPQRLFTPLGSNITDVNFFVAGTTTPARIRSFGAIFSDVDTASTSMQFFDGNGQSLGTFVAPAASGSQTLSFLGVEFSTTVVSRVRITTGNSVPSLGATDNSVRDIVVMDDFIYDEPISATATPTPTATATPTATPTATATATATPAPARLLNMSSRARVLTGDQILIDGFIISGSQNKNVALRGLGPSLTGQGVPGAVQDCVIELYSGSTSLKLNDNWKIDDATGTSQEAAVTASGVAPSDARESVVLATLAPGAYTVVLRGKSNTTGNAVLEIYDLSSGAASNLANISGRAFVDTGDNVLFGGFISGAGGGGASRIVIRALGPSLTALGVPAALALQDPTLDVFNGSGTLLVSNDNWADSQQSEIEATGLAPSDPRESAVTGLAMPGSYTAIVRGKNGTTGVGLVEIYQTN